MFYLWFSLYAAIQKTISDEVLALIAYVAFFLVTIIVVFVLFFMTFQKRKNKLIFDQLRQKQEFEEELVRTQQEIQEETLKHIGRELHDNVGQLLSVATMQMNAVTKVVGEDAKPKMANASNALKECLTEVRALSKSLNSDVIFNIGFDSTVKNEVSRLTKTGLIEVHLAIVGDKVNFENKKDEIILFRILQEFFSNTLKYSEAENLFISIDYKPKTLNIELKDDGIGFNLSEVEQGSGMTNMKKRSELIDADFKLHSQAEKGTVLTLSYPYKIT